MKPIAAKPGISLVEVMVAMVLLGLAAAAISQAVIAGQMNAYDGQQRLFSSFSGEELMERILALPYDDPQGVSVPGPESGESSPNGFDNLDDYHGYDESAGATTAAGSLVFPERWDIFNRSVTVAYISQTVTGLSTPVDGVAITVTMTDAWGADWTLGRFVADP